MSSPSAVERPVRWLEISADFQCNNRCIGCYSVQNQQRGMTKQEILTDLMTSFRRGARSLWLGGGEPTLRPDLFGIVKAARAMGYTQVKLQTNGMLLAYPAFAKSCVDAGVTEVNFAIKGASAASHDRLTRTPGCWDLMMKGIDAVRALGLPMEGDILVYRSNAAELPEMVRTYTARGIGRYNVWLFSAVDQGDKDLANQVPKLSDAVQHIKAAMDLKLSDRPDFITSLHTPPCTVPASHHACLFHAAELSLLVSNPGGYQFFLEESPIEGGHYLPGCATCAARPGCGGIRLDYLNIYGPDEFQPMPAM